MTVPDTVIWSLFLRRKKPNSNVKKVFLELIENRQIGLFGVIKQEILSGIQDPEQFDFVAAELASFPTIFASDADHVTAAKCFNICRAAGIQGSHIDFLIVAMSMNYKCRILTSDKDFGYYRKCLTFDLSMFIP